VQEKVDVKVPKCDLTSHTARRTFVMTELNEGADLNMIAIITSHSDFNAMKPNITRQTWRGRIKLLMRWTKLKLIRE